jgi:hypothetical protein
MKTKYIISSLGIEVQGPDDVGSMRPQWLVRFDPNFRFQSQYRDEENKLKKRIAFVTGPFRVEKIIHNIDKSGHYQHIYLKEDNWKAVWVDDPT